MDVLLETINDLYEAAISPELWTPALEKISRLIGHAGGCLIAIPPGGEGASFVASEVYRAAAAFVVDNDMTTSNPYYARTMALKYDGFVVDLDIFTLEDWRADPVNQFMGRNFDAGFGVGTNILRPDGVNLGVRFAKRLPGEPTERETAARLDLIRPHLARASLTASRLAYDRARTAVLTLQTLGRAGAALSRAGKLVVANDLFEAYENLIRPAAFGRLRLAPPRLDALFANALQRLAASEDAGASCSIPVPAAEDAPPLVLHLLPLVRSARDAFSAAQMLLIVTPLDRPNLPPNHLLHGLFDLTPAESSLTRSLLSGSTLDAIAEGGGLSIETVRKRLKSVFAKTGTRRQAELVALLSGLPTTALRT